QVYVDVDADYLEFRRAVGNVPGLYRLDQCDEDGQLVEDAQPAYVSIEATRNATASGDADPLVIVRDLASINADVSKTMADRFAAVMHATSEILRAADGAGIAHRTPLALPAPGPTDKEGDDEEDEDDHDEPASPSSWAFLAPLIPIVQPMLP